MQKKIYKIVLTGGGTAGHVMPHFALFEGENSLTVAQKNHQLAIHYVGSYTGMEKNLVQNSQPTWIYHKIFSGKIRRYFSWKNFIDPFFIFLGFLQTFFLFLFLRPHAIFSKGGFISVPVVMAAWCNRIPIIIHESDSSAALATKLSMLFAKTALFAFEEAPLKFPKKLRKKCRVVGIPIRQSLLNCTKKDALEFFQFNEQNKVLLIFGGSLGARSLNEKINNILPKLIDKYQVIHITGKGNINSSFSHPSRYKQFEFLNAEMKYAYAAADLAICRAGATSLFELAAAKLPMLLIPLGKLASRGDQIINATLFQKKGWAQFVEESQFVNQAALDKIDYEMNCLEKRKENLKNAPSYHSTTQIAELLLKTMIEK